MKPQAEVLKTTRSIAIGTCVLLAVMLLIYLVIGKLTVPVAAGGACASAVAILNFFALGMTVQRSVEGIQGEDEAQAQRARSQMQLSYSLRMLLLFGAVAVLIAVLHFDPLACVLPLVFPRLTIAFINIIGRKSA